VKVKDSARRLDAAKKALKDMSDEFKSFYLTMSDYDIVAIDEAPDDAMAARFNLQLGMLGNVRTQSVYRSSLSRTRWASRLRCNGARRGGLQMQFTVGFKLKGKADHVVADAQDALDAALKVKTERPEAVIMYVRPQNRRGDTRHPSHALAEDTH
jgi:uncharacterized protein with GYD domain